MTTYTARSVEDVLALVPVLIGFEPEESIVMLTFGGRAPFHARLDLPPPDDVAEAVDSLLAPACRHGVDRVWFVLVTALDGPARDVADALRRRFVAAGVGVVDVVRVHEGRRYSPLGDPGVPPEGVPYDVSTHPFRVQAVVEGRVVARSREELAARLHPDATAVAAVEATLARGAPEVPDGPGLRGLLEEHLLAGSVPREKDAARLLLAVRDARVRDFAWYGMRRAEAAGHVRLWTDLVRRAPQGLVAGAAAVLAFAAWTHGDGALAWCAVDRCLQDAPGHSLGRLVADALRGAVPPLEGRDDGFPWGSAG